VDSDSFIDYSGVEQKPNPLSGKIKILTLGAGGAGGSVVRRMIENGLDNVDYAIVNTDQIAINSNPAPIRIPIGKNLTKGLGAGMKPDLARAGALEDIEDIRSCLEGVHMLFITAGMGGGTGTGASPVIAEVAKELGILTIAVVTTPFSFEGNRRMTLAKNGIEELKKYIDTLVIVPNERLLTIAPQMTMNDAFVLADDVLRNAIFGVSNLITGESDINLDFADVQTVLKDKGRAFIGIGTGKGDTRGEQAAQKAMSSPVLNDHIVKDATGVIIHMEVDPEFTIQQVQSAAEIIKKEAKENADVIWGYKQNSQLQSEVRFTLIAAGFEEEEEDAEMHRQANEELDTEPDEDVLVLGEEQIQDTPHIPDDFHSEQKKTDIDTPAFIRNQESLFPDKKKEEE
jgi:cell division protein FtsZ